MFDVYLVVVVQVPNDIAFHMSILCSFMSDPSQECYDAAIALLLYVGATKHKTLVYPGLTDAFPGLENPRLAKNIAGNQGVQAYSLPSWCDEVYKERKLPSQRYAY